MESGFRTPLLEFFRRGDVAPDVRMLAAQGALAPRAHEQLGLLALLVTDPDPKIAAAAEATLGSIPRGSIEAFLGRPDAGAELVNFFAGRGIAPAPGSVAANDGPLVDTAPEVESDPEGDEVPAGKEREATLQKIAALNVAQRIALAMKGSREERSILIRDPNKIVGVSVLSSPKLSDQEVESIAKMPTISDELLRMIANTRKWVKNYQVVAALTKNPKTPLAVSMNLLQRLNDKDTRLLSSDRNVPEVLRVSARKKLVLSKP